MTPLSYAVFFIYLVSAIISAPLLCVLTWLTYAQARRRRLKAYLAWLVPSAIAMSVILSSVFVYATASILHIRSAEVATLTYGLAACASPFSICATVRLWKMVRALPPFVGDLPPQLGGGDVEGDWPPPPRVR